MIFYSITGNLQIIPKPGITCMNDEDKRLFAKNKWLIAHPDTDEAKQGAVIGITGENVDISELI